MFPWLCSIVLALSTVWFISLLSQLYQKRGKAKIPSLYMIFNMVSASEQLNICYFNSMFLAKRGHIEAFAKDSRNWMHLFQVTTIWMIFSLVIILINHFYAPGSHWSKWQFAISLGLLQLFLLRPLKSGRLDRDMGDSWTSFYNLPLYMNPAATCAVFHYVWPIPKLRLRPHSTSTLGLLGLASQAVAHIVLAYSWLSIMYAPYSSLISEPWAQIFFRYNTFLWAPVDNAIFAVIQGRLLWLALKERKRNIAEELNDESEEEEKGRPLLGLP